MFKSFMMILAASGALTALYGILVDVKKDKPSYESLKGFCKIFCTSLAIVLSIVVLLIVFS